MFITIQIQNDNIDISVVGFNSKCHMGSPIRFMHFSII